MKTADDQARCVHLVESPEGVEVECGQEYKLSTTRMAQHQTPAGPRLLEGTEG